MQPFLLIFQNKVQFFTLILYSKRMRCRFDQILLNKMSPTMWSFGDHITSQFGCGIDAVNLLPVYYHLPSEALPWASPSPSGPPVHTTHPRWNAYWPLWSGWSWWAWNACHFAQLYTPLVSFWMRLSDRPWRKRSKLWFAAFPLKRGKLNPGLKWHSCIYHRNQGRHQQSQMQISSNPL